MSLVIGMKETGHVGHRQGARNADTNFGADGAKLCLQSIQRRGNTSNQACGFSGEKEAGFGNFDGPCGAVDQIQSEALLQRLHLSSEGALRKPGLACGPCETAMLHDEVKEVQGVEVERFPGQVLLHQ